MALVLAALAVAGPARAQDAGIGDAAVADVESVVATEPVAMDLPPATTPAPAVNEALPPAAQPVVPAERPRVVVRTILGLLALLALAYLGGHPAIAALEARFGLTQLITTGAPFVVLGAVARLPGVDVLSDATLADLGPVLRFALGWIGFIIGFRFNAKLIGDVPAGTSTLVAVRAAVTLGAIVGAAAPFLLAAGWSRSALADPVFLRDALVLGTAGALTSLTTPDLLRARGAAETSVARVAAAVRLEELAGIVGLFFIAAYFRPRGSGVTWTLPGTGWLLLALGLGAAMGVVVYAVLLRKTAREAEALVLTLGSVAFTAGMAGRLSLSPVVVCFVVGALVANLPGAYHERLAATLQHIERPIYLVFLAVVGAIGRFSDAGAWGLMIVFVAARFAGKAIGTRAGELRSGVALAPEAREALSAAPMGALSLAVVVSALLLYPGGAISRIVTAVVGGAILTELLVQLRARRPA